MTDIILRGPIQRDYAIALLGKLDLSKPWRVSVTPYKKKRTQSQSNLYWKWIGIISNETGNDADDLHEFFKAKFLPPVSLEVAGETAILRRSTTKLKTDQMSRYMTQVEAFAASQLGIALPTPGFEE